MNDRERERKRDKSHLNSIVWNDIQYNRMWGKKIISLNLKPLTCNENSYKEGSNCATAPTASSAILIQSANDNDTIRGVKHDHKPASVTSLHPASSSSNSDCNL